jgi:hypothetical protein
MKNAGVWSEIAVSDLRRATEGNPIGLHAMS